MDELQISIKEWIEMELDKNHYLTNIKKLHLPKKSTSIDVIVNNFQQNSRFYKLEEIGFDSDAPKKEAIENILATIHNPHEYNFVYILSGSLKGIEIYLGMVKNYSGNESSLNASVYGNLLKSSVAGNFQGSRFRQRDDDHSRFALSENQIEYGIMQPLRESKRAGIITGIPSLNKQDTSMSQDQTNYQGIDRLINSMSGAIWQLMIVCEPIERTEAVIIKNEVYNYYDEIYQKSKKSVQLNNSTGTSTSISQGKTKGNSSSKNAGHSTSTNAGSSSSESYSSSSSGKTTSKGGSVTEGSAKSENSGETINKSDQTTKNSGETVSQEYVNKRYLDIIKYFDDTILKRADLGINKGFYKTAMYTFAKNLATMRRLQNNIISIFQGEDSDFSPIRAFDIKESSFADYPQTRNEVLLSGQIFEVESRKINKFSSLMLGIPAYRQDNRLSVSTYLTTEEVSILTSFPTKEVPGLILNEGIDFGLNIPNVEKGIDLGYILNKGFELKQSRVVISKDILNKHIFMAGVTGSGKTTTAQKLLIESKMPFMVIEPAKTEYRILFKDNSIKGKMEIYTLGNEQIAPFRFNPFELLEDELITSHIDTLKAAFIAAFPMEAAMPYIIEESIYKIYEDYGWNIHNNTNRNYKSPWKSEGQCWPIFSDMIESLKIVIKSKEFGPELESNYIGALVARFSNLVIGSKGKMLNCRNSIDINRLLDKKVIIELEELKDPREKSLMMGFILGRVAAAVKRKHAENPDFKHITLIEEAHRLLSKTEYGDDGSKKLGVEVFCDLLAEVRKYGESFIIIDQIPNKLTNDVLKNTNTKIIHRIFSKDDKNAVGNTMVLNEKQEGYLSFMRVGEAVMLSQGWNKSVNIQIERTTDTSSSVLTENELKDIIIRQLEQQRKVYFPEYVKFLDKVSSKDLIDYQKKIERPFKLLSNKDTISEVQNLENLYKKFNIETFNIKDKSLLKDIIVNDILNMQKNEVKKNRNVRKDFKKFFEFFFLKQFTKLFDEIKENKKFKDNLEYFKKIK